MRYYRYLLRVQTISYTKCLDTPLDWSRYVWCEIHETSPVRERLLSCRLRWRDTPVCNVEGLQRLDNAQTEYSMRFLSCDQRRLKNYKINLFTNST